MLVENCDCSGLWMYVMQLRAIDSREHQLLFVSAESLFGSKNLQNTNNESIQ